jgi:hypothetical protein
LRRGRGWSDSDSNHASLILLSKLEVFKELNQYYSYRGTLYERGISREDGIGVGRSRNTTELLDPLLDN